MTRPAAEDDAAVRLWNSLGCPAWKLREIADALAQAHAEGRAEALREAAVFLENEAHEYGLGGAREAEGALNQTAETIRSLAAGGPKPEAERT